MRNILCVIAVVAAAVGMVSLCAGCAGKDSDKDAAAAAAGGGGAGGGGTVPGPIGGPTGTGTVSVSGTYYLYYVPESLANRQNVPMVLFCHGTNDYPEYNIDEWQPAADAKGFVWIGLKSADFNGPYWSSDEIPTVTAVVNDAVTRWAINTKRIYMSGYSGGGGFTVTTCTSPTGQVFAAMACFCNPYDPWHLDFDSNPNKIPCYFATNADDYNYDAGPAWRDYFAAKGHPSRFKDETGRVSGHFYDAQSAYDAYNWMYQFYLP